jgi:hypothetical protein
MKRNAAMGGLDVAQRIRRITSAANRGSARERGLADDRVAQTALKLVLRHGRWDLDEVMEMANVFGARSSRRSACALAIRVDSDEARPVRASVSACGPHDRASRGSVDRRECRQLIAMRHICKRWLPMQADVVC